MQNSDKVTLKEKNFMSVLINALNEDFCFPGNWSSILFLMDNHKFPSSLNSADLARAVKNGGDYKTFFQQTRNFSHPLHNKDDRIWKTFNNAKIMLNFENIFIKMLDKDFLSMEDEY